MTVESCRADLKDQSSLFIMQIRWLWREQWPFKVSKRISRRMRDIFWGGVQPIMVRGGVQPTTTTIITTITRSRWHGGVGKLNFQPYCKGRSGTGEKETHYINVVGKTPFMRNLFETVCHPRILLHVVSYVIMLFCVCVCVCVF